MSLVLVLVVLERLMDVRGEEDFWEFFEEGLHLFLGSSRIFECIGETISTSVVVVWLLFVCFVSSVW